MTVKIVGDKLSEQDRDKFYEIFGNICDHIYIEYTSPCWPGFEVEGVNQEVGIYGQPLTNIITCPYPLYSIKINSDGSVSVCFLDYKHQSIIGDLRADKFIDVWNGQRLKGYQIMHLKGERHSHPMCGKCGQLRYGAPDNIDPFSGMLLKKLLDK
jgi:MoaA/NifB/PqqE/SkfB family radical SAM enzyme